MTTDSDRNYPPYVEHTYTFVIPAGQVPVRLDAFLTEAIPNATRTKVQEAIDNDAVRLNNKPAKASRKIQPGDVITCHVMKPPPLELVPENIPLEILYEDDAVLVINKPAGMVSHPGFGNRYGTLVNAVLWHVGVRDAIAVETIETSDNEAEETDNDEDDETEIREAKNETILYASDAVRPGIVHRLDKETSGILVVSKDVRAHAKLAKQFAERTAKREYYALVWGSVKEDTGTIEGNIARSPRDRKLFAVSAKTGKHAVTDYTVLERFEHLTLLALRLRTGRTHQIRVHCAHIKHPLFGDPQYGGNAIIHGGQNGAFRSKAQKWLEILPRQALHARMLGFTHPVSGVWMEFSSELPQDFRTVLDALRNDVIEQKE